MFAIIALRYFELGLMRFVVEERRISFLVLLDESESCIFAFPSLVGNSKFKNTSDNRDLRVASDTPGGMIVLGDLRQLYPLFMSRDKILI